MAANLVPIDDIWEICRKLVVASCMVCVGSISVRSAEIMVNFDDLVGHAPLAEGAIYKESFGPADMPFRAHGFPDGVKIKNDSDITLTDLHIHINFPDTFDPKSSGGTAFPKVDISPSGRDITFSGGNISPGSSFWTKFPPSAEFGGTGTYSGRATPTVVTPPPTPGPMPPETGSKSPNIQYDGNGTLSVGSANIN